MLERALLDTMLVGMGLAVGSVGVRLLCQLALRRYNSGVLGYAANGLAAVVLAGSVLPFSSVAAVAVALGGAVALVLRIGEDFGRTSVLRRSLERSEYWRGVYEDLGHVWMSLFFLACLFGLYAVVFRLWWGAWPVWSK